MFVRSKLHIIALLALCFLLLPSRIHANSLSAASFGQIEHSLPEGLEEAAKRALGPNFRPMEYPVNQQTELMGDVDTYYFGWSVALSADGNTALIGAPGEAYHGAVYVFIRSGSTWTQDTQLFASDFADDDWFGWSVALNRNGTVAVVGVPFKDDVNVTNSGAVYIFTHTNDVWVQQAKITASDKVEHDHLGWSVALSVDSKTVLIGADGVSDNGMGSNGAAYVFTSTNTVWSQQAKLLANDRATGDRFGASVALSADGNLALIGAPIKDQISGAAYVFTRLGNMWTQESKLLSSDIASEDRFGASVALSTNGNTALIGASGKNANATFSNGAAYIFTHSGINWSQQAKLVPLDNSGHDAFGISAALSADGNIAVIGANIEDDNYNLQNTGAAYVYTRAGSDWSERVKLVAADRVANDRLGTALSLSADGNNVFISTPYGGNRAGDYGVAYVFVSSDPNMTPTPTNTPLPPHPDTIGVYKDGVFYLRNSNNSGFADITVSFNPDTSDLPLAGDWNGDGIDTIGIYRTSTGFFYLTDSNISPVVNYATLFGNPGDTPFAGRWVVGMTHDGIGVYRNSNGILYQRKSLTNGFDDFFAVFGNPGDQGVAGDWDGNGFDSIGIYRSSNLTWFLTNNSTPTGITFSDVNFEWDIGSGAPVVGDWDGNGNSTVGYLDAAGITTLHSANASAGTDIIFAFGPINSKPIAGKWKLSSTSPAYRVFGNGQPGLSDNNVDVSGAD